MKRNKLLGLIAVPAAMAIVLAGCANQSGGSSSSSPSSEAAPVSLTVSAAASLTDVMNDIKTAYESKHKNVTITNTFGASGTLQKQIENGADADIFFSAAQSNMDSLEKESLLLDGTRKDIVGNTIEFIVPKDGGKTITSLDELKGDSFKQIALGNPDAVPAGKYATQILTDAGVYDAIKSKIVQGSDVRATLNYVETGNAEGGFVFSTDAKSSDKVKSGYTIPADKQPKITYPAAVIKASKNQDAAKALVTYLSSSEAQKLFEKYGFSAAK